MKDTREKIYDNPQGWVQDHIREYVATDGKQGHLWRGFPTLLLTMRGRKSGKLRRTALIYGRDGDNYLVVASKGGAPRHPDWYLNLMQTPQAEIQVQEKKIAVRARAAAAGEKPRLWKIMAGIYPPYDEYQQKTGRVIPVVILEPEK